LEDILAEDNIIIEEEDDGLTTQHTGTRDMMGSKSFSAKINIGAPRSGSTNKDKTKQ
jgi:hypothetical protein